MLTYAKYYFILHIDVYQVKNTANIDIYSELHNLTNTQKDVSGVIIKSGISNYPRRYRHLYMYN